MKEFNTIEEILDFAMQEEQAAVDFYTRLAEQAKTKDMKAIFEEFAKEEIGHKAKLHKIKEEGLYRFADEKVADLKISDYTVNIKATPGMSYDEALVLAMDKEKAAFKLYSALAERAQDQEMKDIFQMLALEESKHKLRFELEYDEYVLKEN